MALRFVGVQGGREVRLELRREEHMTLLPEENEQFGPLDTSHDFGFRPAELDRGLPETGTHWMLLSCCGRFRPPADHIPGRLCQPLPFYYSTGALGSTIAVAKRLSCPGDRSCRVLPPVEPCWNRFVALIH